jgi:glycosyltransferase involved in cell wall biosynthesis
MGKEAIRVLHIDTERGWRGGQQQVVYLLNAMYENGNSTELICQPNSEIEKHCVSKGLPCQPVKMCGEADFVAGLKIAHYSKKNNFNILHLHSAHALGIGIWAKIFYSRLKLIAVRRVDFHIKKNWLSQFKYNTTGLDKIVCISDGIKQVLIEDGIPLEKLITIHSGIDLHKFEEAVPGEDFKQQLGITEHDILIGTVAAMVDHKDYPNLLKAARIVIDKHNSVTFCAVGDGDDKNKILKLAEDLSLGNKFIFAGFRDDIGKFLKSFDIFVLTSKLEGMGTSILDAQAVGLPIVACETGGIPDIISHNQNGLLVPPSNEKALAEAISILIEKPKLRQKLAKKALETVKRFDIQRTVKKSIKLYQEILG